METHSNGHEDRGATWDMDRLSAAHTRKLRSPSLRATFLGVWGVRDAVQVAVVELDRNGLERTE